MPKARTSRTRPKSGFKALAWLNQASRDELARRVDLPSCRADLHYVTKLALALDSGQ